jgi:hypothetical protein
MSDHTLGCLLQSQALWVCIKGSGNVNVCLP